MATKAQIARKKFGCSLSELTPGEKSAVTREFNAQNRSQESAPRRSSASGYATVKFGRPGVNGVKESVVHAGTSIGDALEQAGLTLNKSKEGIITKSGNSVSINDTVVDGTLYLLVPGVDSSI